MSLPDQDYIFADAIERLRVAAHEDRAIDAAQVHLINLQEIIRGAGSHWPLIKDTIRIGSMRFLKGCVGDFDIVIPAGDGFLIIFAEGRAEDLRARAQELRALLLEFYLGQQSPTRDLKVEVEHRRVEPRDMGALIGNAAYSIVAAVEFMFAPAWSPAPQLIGSYFCVPAHRVANGVRYGYDPDYPACGRHSQREFAQTDIAMLDVAEEAMARHTNTYGAAARPILGVSVHATTMQNRAARAAYVDRLSRLNAEQAKHLYVEIAEIEPGAPAIHLAEWAGFLRTRVRAVLLECHHSEPMPPKLDEIGAWGAGYQAPDAINHGDAEAEPHLHQLIRWGESLARQKKKFFLDNLRRPALVRRAAEAGASFLTSDAFWPCVTWPGGVISMAAPDQSPFSQPQKTLSSA